MATDLDELQIKITSSAEEADKAIGKLVNGLENLNKALGNLDVSKVTSFANAVSKLANIGNNTNTTAKALKGMASEIADSFGIRTKKGVEDITTALQALYNSARNLKLNDSLENNNVYFNNLKNMQKAIEDNYKYKESVDEATKSVVNYIKAQNQSGSKVAMHDMVAEFGDDFKDVTKVLGKAFNNKLKSTEGAQDLAEFFNDMNAAINTTFKTGNDQELKQSLDDLVGILSNAKDKVYDFSGAVKEGLVDGESAANAAYEVADRLFALIKEQDQYGASSGLGGVAEVFKQISNIQMPDMSGVADAVKTMKTNPPTQTAQAIQNIGNASKAATGEVSNLVASLDKVQRVIEGNEIKDYQRGFTMSNPTEYKNVEFPPAVVKQAQIYQEKLQDVGTTALALADQFKNVSAYAEEAYKNASQFGDADFQNASEGVEEVANKAEEAAQNIEQAKKQITEPPKGKVMGDVLSNLVELGEGLEKLSHHFNNIADKGIGVFKALVTPLKWAASEYVEKFEHIKASIDNFQKNFHVKMKKVSDFWKRTMKTFTFMMVRKAIDAIVKEVGTAIQSLAMYSNAMGTAFNQDISLMVADFQYLGRSIVSVFAPLLNYIVPIIDAIVDKIATLLSYIGMLFAALGGSTSFTKAKKDVGNYAESLDQASKSSKNLTMGIDELNIISEKSGGGSAKPYDGWEDAWEDVKIPKWIQDLSDWFKKLWDDFFNPLKKAWDRAKQYLIDGFKTMINSLKKLFGDIGRDFLEVWNQEKTIRMFEQMLKIVGDLMRVVRNLANAFDEAWNKGKVGLKIFENLRDLLSIIVDHVRNVTYYMIGWAKEIDFYPVLKAFEELTKKLKPLADFIGGVFEDVMIYGVLKYIKFLIEDAIPHLMETIGKIADAFNFPKLRERLQPVWVAFEEMFENIHTGITNAIGNIGVALARFVNSDEFAKFLERIVEITKEITSERVEKVLTGLGEGILSVAKAVVKFVNSDMFMKFIKAIGEWIDKKSTQDIAKILERIAFAIAGFKFAAFATNKLAGFFKFFALLKVLSNLKTMASALTGVATATEALGKTAPSIGALYNPLANIFGLFNSGLSSAQSSLTNTVGAFKNLFSVLGAKGAIGGIFEEIGTAINGFAASLPPLVTLIGSVGTAFLEWKGVAQSANDLAHAINGDDDYSIGGSVLGIIGKIGLASAAFTAFLGFPAGVVAGLVVGAISGIKEFQESIDEINFENVTAAIMTQGENTVASISEWYGQATDVIRTNVDEWKNIERDLVQGRGDIDEYAKAIEGIGSAFESNVQLTTGLTSNLVSSYEDLSKCINNYIDTSTQSMVQNLLAQRSYLEAQGYDVDEMVANLLVGAEKQKDIVTDASNAMSEAQKKYSEAVETFGENSTEAQEAYKNLKDVISETSPVFEQFQSKVDEIDTSEAVEEITKLGNSLDLTQYGDDWDAAVEGITRGVEEIRDKTESGLQEINDTYQSKIDELNEYKARNPMFSEEDYKIQMDTILSQWADDTQTLTSAAEQALDAYDTSLANKLQEVADSAEQKWEETSPFKRWITKMGEKDEYVYSQMQNYVNEHLGESGLTGLINQAYEAIPGNTHESTVSTMTKLVNDGKAEYERAAGTLNVDEMGKLAYTPYQMVIDRIPGLVDYDHSSQAFMDKSKNALKLAAEGTQYDEVSKTIVDGTGKALLNNQTELEDYNRMMAGYGVNAMSDEYKQKLTDNAELYEAIKEFGKGTVESYNTSIDENSALTEESITTWGQKIVDWFHDSPLHFGSPSQTMIDFGKDTVEGFNEGVRQSIASTNITLNTWVLAIKTSVRVGLTDVKTMFNTMFSDIFKGDNNSIVTSITTMFTNITNLMIENINLLGTNLQTTVLPLFMETYILPFFSVEMWQPYFDILLNDVFMVFFETFKTWFTDEAMTPWWEEDLLFWFKKEKWDEEIFTPLADNIHDHWDTFSQWWDATMLAWWTDQVLPWFEKKRWEEQFNHILDVTKEVFDLVRDAIKERINQASEAVTNACDNMKSSIAEVIDMIGQMMDALSGFEGFEGSVTFEFGAQEFAEGGFPTRGSLFWASENDAGAEFVGTVGGHTGVVSNGEITGIADAVYATSTSESELLAQLISIGREMLMKDPVVFGDKEIALAAERGKNRMGMSIIS